jgi:tripartite-type tricarboxylate transporter receptor subunit TctC
MRRRVLVGLAALATAPLGMHRTAAAQAFPSKGLRIIVPFPAGGPTDQVARMVAQKLQDQYGQSVVVDNRPGGGGQIGMSQVQQAPADGHTLIIGDMGLYAINTTLYTKLSYDVQKELVPITLAMSAPMVLIVPANSPDNSVADLVRRARSGATLNFASQGIGTGGHLIGEMMRVESGGRLNHVPYKGSAPAMQDLIAGQVDLFFEVLGAALPQAKAGKVKMLALAAPQRSKLAPDLPTTAEVGFPQITMAPWFGFAARTGTPEPALRKLQADIVAAINSPDIVTRLQTVGFDPIPGTPEQMAKVIRDETERWGAVVRSSGAKVE